MEFSVDQEIIRILANVEGQVEGGQNMPVIEIRPNADQYATSDQNGSGVGAASGMVADAIQLRVLLL